MPTSRSYATYKSAYKLPKKSKKPKTSQRRKKGKVTRKEVNRLARKVGHLQTASEIKRIYSHADNVNVSNGDGVVQNGAFIVLPLTEIPVVTPQGTTPAIELGRGQNSLKVLIKNLHIRFSMHASEGVSRSDTNKWAVYLIRSQLVRTGAPTGDVVRPPTQTEFFDFDADFTGGLTPCLLSPQTDGFRNSNDDAITKVSILKKWSGILTPQQFEVSDDNLAPPNPYEYNIPSGGAYKSQSTVHYSTRQLNATIKYNSATDPDPANPTSQLPSNQAYYLIAVTDTSEARAQYLRLNAVVATTFKDD